MTRRDPKLYLRDMLDHARRAIGHTQGRTRTDLDADELLSLALVRLIEIVGEAASRVPAETRTRLPHVPWQMIIGMRNRLIHAYSAVDNDVVWDTLTNSLPPLVVELERVLADMTDTPEGRDAP